MISISNDCRGGSIWCCEFKFVLYCFHSHSNLSLGMVIKWFPLFIKMWAFSCMICMVGWVVFMSESGLHSFRFIWIKGRWSGSFMYLASFDCGWWKCFSIML
jgi:hypothetical protein